MFLFQDTSSKGIRMHLEEEHVGDYRADRKCLYNSQVMFLFSVKL